jgi:hypothetical protein
MTASWDPSIDLESLLVALEAELLSVSDEELRIVLAESGRAREAALHEMRTVVEAAMRDEDVATLPHIKEPMAACARVWRH